MEIKVFANEIKQKIEEIYYDGYNVNIEPMTKNNGIRLIGITIIKEGVNIAPNIYLESLFERYQNGSISIEEACKEVIDIYEQHKETQDFDSRKVTEFHQVRDRICLKLINAEKNKELLADTPYIPYLDLAIVFYALVSKNAGGINTVLIDNSFINNWGMDIQTIYDIAIKNMQRLFKGKVSPIMDIMSELKYTEKSYDIKIDTGTSVLDSIYVATNYEKLNGASIILYPNLLRDFAEQIHSGFYVLPSSIHEVIFVPESAGIDIEYMKTIVRETNVTQVANVEILSDNVYFYDKKNDNLKLF